MKIAIQTIKCLVKTLKFNNGLVTAIVENNLTRGYFKQFFSAKVAEWI